MTRTSTDCGDLFSEEWMESVADLRKASDIIHGLKDQEKELALQVEANADDVKQREEEVDKLAKQIETERAAQRAQATASPEPSPDEEVGSAGVEEAVAAKEGRLSEEREELARRQQAAEKLEQQQAKVKEAGIGARNDQELAPKQRASVVRHIPEQLQLEQRKADAFAHHVSAFASTEQPTADKCVTGLDMQRPLAKEQLEEMESKRATCRN